MLFAASALAVISCILVPVDPGSTPPEDWPPLSVAVHVKPPDFAQRCRTASHIVPVAGCAVLDFEKRTCDIQLRFASDALLRHERRHCDGYDDAGETRVRDGWDRYKLGLARRDAALRELTTAP